MTGREVKRYASEADHSIIYRYTANAIEEAVTAVSEHPENKMHSIFTGHLQGMIKDLNEKDLTLEQIETYGTVAQNMTSFVKGQNV